MDPEKLLDHTDEEDTAQASVPERPEEQASSGAALSAPMTASKSSMTHDQASAPEAMEVGTSSDQQEKAKASKKGKSGSWPKVRAESVISKSVAYQIGASKDGDKCKLCDFVGEAKQLAAHVRIHFSRWFCECGMSARTRQFITDHIYTERRTGCQRHQRMTVCYESDKKSFGILAQRGYIPD